ncbi:hypothetical protein [Methylophaga frappieri]|uniref:hypothetical protein n=1 Tax=Methylophaga frappieri (strain ATCC BAA-2434 / DSM 25690 / JAM7) TaxID=754477 RepID=UPI00059BCA77|nr:hypothetical protein [Methylophaga frappieri]
MGKKKTLTQVSYGLDTPEDLLAKFLHDAQRIDVAPHRYDLFNFFVTGAVLHEWCRKYFRDHPISGQLEGAAGSKPKFESLPPKSAEWITDKSCLPNKGQDARRHIANALRICIETANASKHFHWFDGSGVSAIQDQPQVKDWYQYYFTSVVPGVYIEYNSEYYTVEQVRDI